MQCVGEKIEKPFELSFQQDLRESAKLNFNLKKKLQYKLSAPSAFLRDTVLLKLTTSLLTLSFSSLEWLSL